MIPLRRNSEGYAKIPIPLAWQSLTPEQAATLDWNRASGIGLVLGANSSNRAAIDIDDRELALNVEAFLMRKGVCPLMTHTARGRLHVHVLEPEPSPSRALRLSYHGRNVGVELKATGTQVVIPPTPGYTWVNEGCEPLYATVADAWQGIATALRVMPATLARQGVRVSTAGYPTPFLHRVQYGQHNNGLFVEACRLAENGVAVEKAMLFLRQRFETAYEGGTWGRWADRTILSAYRRVTGRAR